MSLYLVERNVLRSDIDCPGDTLTYNCSILSLSESVCLSWNITLPGFMPRIITYDNTSILNDTDILAIGIGTMLTQFRSDEYIESIIILTVVRNVSLNNSIIQCSIGDLDRMSRNVFVNSSGNTSIIDPEGGRVEIKVECFTQNGECVDTPIDTCHVLTLMFLNSSSRTFWIQYRQRILYNDRQHCYV